MHSKVTDGRSGSWCSTKHDIINWCPQLGLKLISQTHQNILHWRKICLKGTHILEYTPFLKGNNKLCIFTQNVIELVQVVLSRKDWPIRQHLCQDASY